MILLRFEIFLHFMARAGNRIFELKIPTDAKPGRETISYLCIEDKAGEDEQGCFGKGAVEKIPHVLYISD